MIRGLRLRVLLVLLLVLPAVGGVRPAAADQHMPRRVLALYNGAEEARVRSAAVHQIAAMPLNWLGLVVDYADVRDPLPPVWEDEDVVGVLSWFQSPQIADGPAYLDWTERVIASGRPFVVLGDVGVSTDAGRPGGVSLDRLGAFFAALGIDYRGGWSGVTYDSRLETPDPPADGVAVPIGEVIPPFEVYRPTDPSRGVAFTIVSRPDGAGPAGARIRSHVALTTPRGGFVAPGFTHSRDPSRIVAMWHIDPFRFFAAAFRVGGRPVPDVTTLVGRRVYYSHVDGDGWLSRSTARPAPRGGERPLAAEVIRRAAIEPYPDLPVTVAPIADELDPAWVGTEEAQAIARALFALPQVEPASHTYTHPFQWDFFDPYDPAREAPFAAEYARTRAYAGGEAHEAEDAAADDAAAERRRVGLRLGYTVPRAYGGPPFDMTKEMAGAAETIGRFVPPGKRVTLVQWSGDTSPTPGALRAARAAGLSNINGGDSRMDADFPTVASVAPIGRRLAGEIQVYASNSNENTYTDLWRGRFHGFRDVIRTWDATGAPRRLKPVNLYYHMYSGERPAGLRALLENLEDVRRRELAPVATSDYVRSVEGFFAVRLVETGPAAWRVEDRGALQTLRFAVPEGTDVDPAASTGVLGSRRFGDQLYVALDPDVATPTVTLAPGAAHPGPWLVHARWPVRGLERRADGFAATAAGFGAGEMVWRVPVRGPVAVEAGAWRTTAVVGADGLLTVTVPPRAEGPVPVRVEFRWRT